MFFFGFVQMHGEAPAPSLCACLIPDERARCYGGAGPVGTGPIQRPTYTNIVSVMKSAIVTSRTSLLLAALAHRATGSAAPMTAASEMRRRWCAKNERVAVRALP